MKPVNIFSCLLFCLFFLACKRNGDIIKDADRVVIYYNTGNTVYKHQDSSKNLIKKFSEVLDGKEEKRKCPTQGEIRFYSKDSILFEAGFSIEGGKNGCEFLMKGEKAWRLTYQTGMYLSETLADLIQKK